MIQQVPLAIMKISTHSLTKRLTDLEWSNQRKLGISTHSLTKRLTASSDWIPCKSWHFNSQPHEEADSA